ncbi:MULTISPECIES: protease modulator HflC [Idiomarina]|jgi:membrane protease subunit HflC|uniref:Protein HflC n=2 Tax=Idiomarina baltica TaxID=190892 RepID=A0A348WRB2_9GAMM|nr:MULTISPECIES: protease modulator HflC [Idiomarina]EAQ33094.1 Membrane protease, stomatin/prohibitin family protein [Idiomarina baltica OS145]MBL74259.1 protease modulator HflC [Idiomarinaceae bacterium]MBR37947.1 protease modulator HflC [Idiomarina sp.]HAR57074.1 protease modulator HflC [Idiomarina baltica]|tara:strand:- start:1569 stop:2462 length:894 start_codon:yes stop_codon:yes gene_type:complete
MKNLIAIIVVVLVALGLSSLYVVKEGERAILIQFGKVERNAETGEAMVFEPGLHFKIPFIEQVKRLDARLQTLDGDPDRFVTSEKKDLIVDTYVMWRINDFSTFYLSTNGGNKMQAEALLTRRINSGLRSEFGSRTISDIVSGERDELMREALIKGAESASDLGVEVVDVRVMQINLPDEVSQSIYQRMRAERQAVATEHRSEGREQAEIIRADVDARVTVMLADAKRQSRQLRGEGDAQAAKIYADSYQQDPEFFAFIRSMQAYSESFSSGSDVLVLDAESDFFRYLQDLQGEPKE